MPRNRLKDPDRRLRSRLAQLVSQAPLLRGNLITMKRQCGKSNCRCARGELHVSRYLSLSVQGKAQTIYIPADRLERVQQAVGHHQEVRRLLERLCREELRRLRQRED